MTRILFAAGAALLLAACSDENDQAGNNDVGVPANGAEAVDAAGTGSAPSGDSSGATSQPPAPVEPDPSDPPPVAPPVPANNQVSSSDEPPPATEDEYIHGNKSGENPPG